MIKFEVDAATAVGIIQACLKEQEGFTKDPVSCPQRIVTLRAFIGELDAKLTEYLKEETDLAGESEEQP